MHLFPMFLKLEGRECLVVGAGSVALEKVTSVLQAGARVRVVAPDTLPAIEDLALEGKIRLERRAFEERDVEGASIAIAATNLPAVNNAVYRAAQRHNVLCNSVDDPPNCDFYFGAVVRRGDLQIAISTAGQSPALAQRLRREIDAQLPQELGSWLAEIGQRRREILATHPNGEARKAFLHALADPPFAATLLDAFHQRAELGVVR